MFLALWSLLDAYELSLHPQEKYGFETEFQAWVKC